MSGDNNNNNNNNNNNIDPGFYHKRPPKLPLPGTSISGEISKRLIDKFTLADFYPNDQPGRCTTCYLNDTVVYPVGPYDRPENLCKTCLRRLINQTRLNIING